MKSGSLLFYFESCKDSKTNFLFVLARMFSNLYSFEGEKITLYRRSNKSSENVIKVREFPLFGPVSEGLKVALAP